MFSRIWTKPSTKSCSEQLERLQTALRDCDAVVIGAGAGLSTAAGFTYTGERFEKYFSDFAAKYGIRDMYSGGFYPFATPEEHWAYWSRYIYINRYHGCAEAGLRRPFEAGGRTRTISSSRRTWTTAFRRLALIKSGCSTRRAITACSSAVSRAVRRPLITRPSSGRWSSGRKI